MTAQRDSQKKNSHRNTLFRTGRTGMSKVDMNAYRANRQRKDILEELRQEGRFYEYLFVSWGMVELWTDQSTLRAYGLSSQNPRAQPLLDLNIGRD
jgi:hypothetical protein